MVQATVKTSVRELSPNTAEPIGLLLGEACLHLCHNRLLRLATQPVMLTLELVAVVLGVVYAPAVTFGAVVGMAAIFLLLVVLYLCWHGWFIHRNRRFKTLCLHCTSRMWQLCCARCRAPVPALALWLWGAFLTHCPHCGMRLSDRKRTLLAWCSTCLKSRDRPGQFYSKPTYVIVWMTIALPVEVKGGWQRLSQKGAQEMVLYNTSRAQSTCLMYISANYRGNELPIKEHLKGQLRLLLISNDVPEEHAHLIIGHRGPRTICERVDPLGRSDEF